MPKLPILGLLAGQMSLASLLRLVVVVSATIVVLDCSLPPLMPF